MRIQRSGLGRNVERVSRRVDRLLALTGFWCRETRSSVQRGMQGVVDIPAKVPLRRGMDPSHAAKIDAYLARTIETTHIPGVVGLVTDASGSLYAGAFGKRATGMDENMTVDTLFRVASMLKPITSLGVMMLVEQDVLSLEDPIEDYLPEFRDPLVFASLDAETGGYTTRRAEASITVRHLLTHTSGIGYAFLSEILAGLTSKDPDVSVFDLPLLHDPGERWTYGQSAQVLGRLIEAVTQQPLDRFLRRRIFGPLGMDDTAYTLPALSTRRVATVHVRTDAGMDERANPRRISYPALGDDGLISTAGDYAKFIRLFLQRGRSARGERIVSEDTIALMSANHIGSLRVTTQSTVMPERSRPFPLGAGRDGFGLGFQITGQHDEHDARRPGSLSWGGIYNTHFWIDPEAGIGAVLLMQYLPYYDDTAIEALDNFEALVYESPIEG